MQVLFCKNKYIYCSCFINSALINTKKLNTAIKNYILKDIKYNAPISQNMKVMVIKTRLVLSKIDKIKYLKLYALIMS